ncbi:hypothetical protein RHMOL_Rhmol06G0149200 [Rhododendron molle]|uniref:Uncharacterized protein n=1 Tax=Rhododendron molle TaxID=49168 RepID=A0ACC0NCB6_RHOML|nr:hypothetical protein RHMOL_Rhmol06G0149200 [Rhododendron molle]
MSSMGEAKTATADEVMESDADAMSEPEINISSDEENEVTASKSKGRPLSVVWKHFDRVTRKGQTKPDRGKCEAIGKALEACLIEWGVGRVCTVTVDNATANDVAVSYLKEKLSKKSGALILAGEFLHMRCCAHIINLIVRDGLGEIKQSISRIRDVVKWNSTYLMLSTALIFQKAFERLEEEDPHFLIELHMGPPTTQDWDDARNFSKFLEKFYETTLHLSGSSYATSNLYFNEVMVIDKFLSDYLKDVHGMYEGDVRVGSRVVLVDMAKTMKKKFDKYWGKVENMNMMMVIAIVLDPRFKLKYVKFCFSELFYSDVVKALTKMIRGELDRVFVEYETFNLSASVSSQKWSGMEIDQPYSEGCDKGVSFESKFQKHLEEEDDGGKLEIDRYLEERCEKKAPNFNILEWWKVNSFKYPILSEIARDALAIPVSTVASEAAFSTGGRVVDQFRSSLSPKLVECLICMQDWLRATPLPFEVEENVEEMQELELVVMDSTIIFLCKYGLQILPVRLSGGGRLKDVLSSICNRWNNLSVGRFSVSYAYEDGYYALQNESDFENMLFLFSNCDRINAKVDENKHTSRLIVGNTIDEVGDVDEVVDDEFEYVDRMDPAEKYCKHAKTRYLTEAWANLIEGVGQEFPKGVKKFRAVLARYAIENGFMYRLMKNDQLRVTVVFVIERCEWHVHAIVNRTNGVFHIKKCHDQHNCGSMYRTNKHKRMSSSLVADEIAGIVEKKPKTSPIDMLDWFTDKYGLDLCYHSAWLGVAKARGVYMEIMKVLLIGFGGTLKLQGYESGKYIEA